MSDIKNARIQAFPGATIGHLTYLVDSNQASVRDFSHVIFHVGTNDVESRSVGEIYSSLMNLVAVTRKKNNRIKILLSSILPRPKDFSILGIKVTEINSHLRMYLCPKYRVQFIASYKPFVFKGKPRRELFAIHDKGLHLNLEGTNKLRIFFGQVIAHL